MIKSYSLITLKKVGNEGMTAQLKDRLSFAGIFLHGVFDEIRSFLIVNSV
jgi:hypothetical protein